jgi:hypothetical protein
MGSSKTLSASTKADKEAAEVSDYMSKLKHKLKPEVEALRKIIKSCDASISERIKWNAPSYYTSADFLTFNLRTEEHVHLIFHHPCIESITSPVLKGNMQGRRMCYFTGIEQIEKQKKELQSVIRKVLNHIQPADVTVRGTQKICSKGHKFVKTSDCPTCPQCEKENKPADNFLSRLAAPARRALINAGLNTVKKLSSKTEKEILSLHGMGPASIPVLKQILKENKLTFKK